MVYSMTGIGTGTAASSKGSIDIEVRTVNSRYLDISCRLPRGWDTLDDAVARALKGRLNRGRASVTVRWIPSPGASPLEVDSESVKAAWGLLQQLRQTIGVEEQPTLSDLLRLERFWATPSSPDPETTELLEQALTEAVDSLVADRQREGEALLLDMRARLKTVADSIDRIQLDEPERTARAHSQLRERVESLLQRAESGTMDETRLGTEVALLAQRLDITEECVRLAAHVDQFEKLISKGSPVGRKLDFLVQEMHRECTTIGAKASDAGVSHIVVEMKAELEKLKEQAANLE